MLIEGSSADWERVDSEIVYADCAELSELAVAREGVVAVCIGRRTGQDPHRRCAAGAGQDHVSLGKLWLVRTARLSECRTRTRSRSRSSGAAEREIRRPDSTCCPTLRQEHAR